MKKVYIILQIFLYIILCSSFVSGYVLDYTHAYVISSPDCPQFGAYDDDDAVDGVVDSANEGDAAFTLNDGNCETNGYYAVVLNDSYYIHNFTLNWMSCSNTDNHRYNVDIELNGTVLATNITINCSARSDYIVIQSINYTETAGSEFNISWHAFDQWNGVLVSEIILYGDTVGSGPPPPDPYNITISLVAPANNSVFSNNMTNFTYNVTYTESLDSCYLYTNTTGSLQINTSNTSVVANITNNYFYFINFSDSLHVWQVGCNSTSGNITNSTESWEFTVDITNPTLITDFVNGSNFTRNISGQFNFSDNRMLFSVNISLVEDDIVIFNTTNINETLYVYNLTYNITTLSQSNKTLSIVYADAHTANSLMDHDAYNPSNGLFGDYIRYDFEKPYKDGYIKITQKDGSLLDSWDTEQKEDKYTFTFSPSTKSNSYTFLVEVEGYLYIVDKPGTTYGKWLVYQEHWIDFYPYTDIDIKRVRDDLVEVTINNVDSKLDDIAFRSVGDLNIVTEHFRFFTYTNVTEDFEYAILDEVQTLLFIEFGNPAHLSPNPVYLEWNGTNYTATQVVDNATFALYRQNVTPNFGLNSTYTQTNVTHVWHYNYTGGWERTEYTNQSVQYIGVDNCDSFTTPAINLTFRRDDTDANIYGILGGYFEVLINGSVFAYNLSWTVDWNVSICISPPTANYSFFTQLEYQNESWNTESYYFDDAYLNNITQLVDLYFTPNSTLVEFTVTDENDDAISGAYIQVLRYDLTTHSYVITEILRTDSEGDALGSIVLDIQWYKFIIIYNSIIVLETEPVKIITTSRNFRIDLQTDFFETYEYFQGVLTSLSFTNITKNFAYTFLTPSGGSVEACLEVTEDAFSASTVLNKTCDTAASGTILINIGTNTSVTERTYTARGTIQTDVTDEDTRFVAQMLSVNFDTLYLVWGGMGIYIVYLVRLTMAMAAIWSPVVAIAMIVITDLLLWWSGLFYIGTLTFMAYAIMAIIVLVKVSRR